MKIITIDNETEIEKYINENVDTNKYVILYLGATWCLPCKKFYPHVENVLSKLSNIDDSIFIKFDIDDADEFCDKYNINSVPTVLFIKNGKIVNKVMGNNPDLFDLTINNLFNCF